MRFYDRQEAGKKLARALEKYTNQKETFVIGLPRGGVVTAYEVASHLHLPLDIVCPRKIGAPFNPEYAIGAITETGEGILDEKVIAGYGIPQAYIQETIEKEKQLAQHRLQHFRQNRPPRDVKGKTVIIVDDGLATGSTMKAAIKTIQSEGASHIVVAVPVAPSHTVREIKHLGVEVVCLHAPDEFWAVGEFYSFFSQTEDDEVVDLLQRSSR